MRILIVSQYFWPEDFRINDLALSLNKRGHEVTVLTGIPNYPEGRFPPPYKWFRPMRENYQGISIVRAPLIARGKGGGIRLALNYASFAIMACLAGPLLLRRDFEAILVYEPSPITVGLPAIVMKSLTGAPILFWVMDLWPESVSATRAIVSVRLLNWIGKLTRFIYKQCDLILAQSHAFVAHIVATGGAPERIRYFPSWAEELYRPQDVPTPPPTPLPTGFRIMFAGNVGAAQDFPSLLAAAERLSDYTDIHWVILGHGRNLDWVRQQVRTRGLEDTVHLLGRHPTQSMPGFFAHADAMLVSLRREPIFALTIPAKVQSYLACAKPIIAMLDGEGARIVREAACGLTCGAEDPEALAQAVLAMYRMTPDERAKLGANGLAYYHAEFDREMLLDRLESWLRELARKG